MRRRTRSLMTLFMMAVMGSSPSSSPSSGAAAIYRIEIGGPTADPPTGRGGSRLRHGCVALGGGRGDEWLPMEKKEPRDVFHHMEDDLTTPGFGWTERNSFSLIGERGEKRTRVPSLVPRTPHGRHAPPTEEFFLKAWLHCASRRRSPVIRPPVFPAPRGVDDVPPRARRAPR